MSMKANLLLNTLMHAEGLKPIQQLAILAQVRQVTGGSWLTDDLESCVEELLNETNILSIICQVLNMSDQAPSFDYFDEHGEPLIRYMKLEAMWTLINIGYGPESAIRQIFDDKYQLIVDYMNRILNQNQEQDAFFEEDNSPLSFDLQMCEQVIWFVGNCVSTSTELRGQLISKLYIFKGMMSCMFSIQHLDLAA